MKLSHIQHRQPARLELSMAGMIDMVFLLLIFFLVAATFVKSERHLTPAIRIEQADAAARPPHLEPVIIDVQRVAETVHFRVGGWVLEDAQRLLEVLEAIDNKAEGAFVRVADDVPFGYAAQAIDAAKQAGFYVVSYLPAP